MRAEMAVPLVFDDNIAFQMLSQRRIIANCMRSATRQRKRQRAFVGAWKARLPDRRPPECGRADRRGSRPRKNPAVTAAGPEETSLDAEQP